MPNTDVSHSKHEATLPGRLAAEALGAFALTLAAMAVDILAQTGEGNLNGLARALAPALAVLSMVFALGEISGAHFNPAVTLAFVLRKKFPLRLIPAYVVAQCVGAGVAALCTQWVFGPTAHLGLNTPHVAAAAAFGTEVVFTFLLVCVVLGTAKQHRILGPEAGLAVGAVLTVAGLVGTSLSGPSLNPARSLIPAILLGRVDHWPLYLFGPLLGSALAVALIGWANPHGKTEEAEAANGN